ncbi:MAG: putative multidrug export ATP-binding/permease protein [bacterium ADurb.Bin425]|nr:MAG: putative multidrug export ATP-binding/permease protein [bacterium ADurb.Bin425]
MLSALEKIIRSCDVFYDLLTGLDKVGHITDLPVERRGGIDMPEQEGGMSVACYDVRFSYGGERSEVLSGLNLGIASGEKASLVGASGAGKTTLAWLLCGIYEPSHGTVELGGFDLRDVSLPSFRRRVGLVGDANEVFEGTIEDNITLGRPYVSHQDVRWALDIAQFSKDLVNMPSGLSTMLVSGGRNLSRGQVQRLLIARALAGRPDLLILDEAFTGIDEATKLKIVEAIFAPENSWTIFDISHDAEVVMRSSRVYVLSAGKIVESGTPADLSWRNVAEFSTLFPDLAAQIRSVERRKTDRSAKV